MYWSKTFHKTLRENPSDAEINSHKLLVRAGLVKKVSQGIFTYSTLGLKVIRKIETIIREELENIECQEIFMPMVQPKSLWDETGRWGIPELLKFKNRSDQDFCLGATHEEVVTDFIRNQAVSYKDYPVQIFQIQTKYRDEIRPRFGLMRGREFSMKDAYSFDVSLEEAKKSYEKYRQAYHNIFTRLGFEYRSVMADAGAIGGSVTEEFQVLAQIGEDELMVSSESSFAANREICACLKQPALNVFEDGVLKKVETRGLRSIDELAHFLDKPVEGLVKTMYYSHEDQNYAILLKGNDQANEIKIKNLLGLSDNPRLLTDVEVKELTGASPGSCGPVGLDIPIYADQNLEGVTNFCVGANQDDFHLVGAQPGRDFEIEAYADLRLAEEGDPSPDGTGVLKSIRGIEVGHIFLLGTKYSSSMGVTFLNDRGVPETPQMGCYGIGVTRSLQAAIEQSHDDNGIIWSKPLTPFQLHVCLLDPKNEELTGFTSTIKKHCEEAGFSVFVDDRVERPGVKFKDADLLGFPVKLTIGKKGYENDSMDIKFRVGDEKHSLTKANIKEEVVKILKEFYS